MHNRSACCAKCADVFHYDGSLVKKTPRVCPQCKLSRVAEYEKSRQQQLTALDSVDGALAVRTYESVGVELGISAESVRKTERSALAKIRRLLEQNNKQIFPPRQH